MTERDQAPAPPFGFTPIGVVRSPFADKFGIPRQARLAPAAQARVQLLPPYDREEAFVGLDGFSHVWLLWVFHADCLTAGWQPMVHPPRLGGRVKVGVFASRAPYRPNPLGISALPHQGLVRERDGLFLRVSGVDVLDGTPVLDIKPYVPYADAIPQARGGFASPPASPLTVKFSPQAEAQLNAAASLQLRALIVQIISQDPRPGYLHRYPERSEFGLRLHGYNVRWRIDHHLAEVIAVDAYSDCGAP